MEYSKKKYVFWVSLIIIALIGGTFIGAFIQKYLAPPPLKPVEDKIGIINVYRPIVSVEDRDYILRMVDYVLENETIKAVVLKINTPGGYADFIEDIYLSLTKLRAKKPVVASVSFGPSGGYYIAVAANYVYATPQAMVGSIGVIGFLPPKPSPHEEIVETGPYKLTGFPVKEYPFKIREALNNFLGTVEKERGEKLKLSRVELSKALLYFGEEALKYGLIDGLGSPMDAVKKAAELANITRFKTVEVNRLIKPPTRLYNISSIADLRGLHLPPALYYIYLPYTKIKTFKTQVEFSNVTIVGLNMTRKNIILVDFSHKNAFQPSELNILVSEIASNGFSVHYVYSFEDLSQQIKNASAFIVISPTEKFTLQEINLTKSFVEEGGKILLVLEPTKASTSEINMIANIFGLVFANGYLYNLEENYGNYRNIIIKNFEVNNLTEGLKEIVLFTTTHIYGEKGVCLTTANTYSSESESLGEYPPIVLSPNEKVLAIGDQTFLTEPYCYIKDNYRLIQNIAKFLTTNSTKTV